MMSPAKQKLLELERTEKYVFHGSPEKLDALHPRQAYNYDGERQKEDGMPAVFASSVADYAILMAIINKKNCLQGFYSSAGTHRDEEGNLSLRFRASKKTMAQLGEASAGYVYVFEKKLFTLRDPGGVEWVSYDEVRPVEVIKVGVEDLPETIQIFEDSSRDLLQ